MTIERCLQVRCNKCGTAVTFTPDVKLANRHNTVCAGCGRPMPYQSLRETFFLLHSRAASDECSVDLVPKP